MNSIGTYIKDLSENIFEKVVSQRRYLHQYPELSFKEFNTSKYIISQLEELNIPYTKGYVETGIVALIEGKNPHKKCFALRADMDALPITEETQLSYASKNQGVMHACGHDVHTSCLLGAAAILNKLKDTFEGTVKLIFQPGEEVLPGGASLMIQEGALKKPDANAIIGQHVFPQLKSGSVGFRSGMYMASCDELHITVTGKGGHAAEPHLTNNPILAASKLILDLYQINAPKIKQDIPTILSLGMVEAKGATNIVPDRVYIQGTFRTMNENWRATVHQLIQDKSAAISRETQTKINTEIRKGYPFLENDEALTVRVKKYATELLGAHNVFDLDLRMGGEDFSYYTLEIPGCFYRLGTSYPHKQSTGLHTSTFEVDENALKTGMALFAYTAINELNTIT